ncbi:hypothetical protein [Arthrobacter sp. H14]|uniref:hypothetical protein n=1 Tax=Arthrobacter sp. H14 TaxID=1312959 RepID=UPI0012DE2C22|nr:hypothetical protein [Arthrobacter sp. H14]
MGTWFFTSATGFSKNHGSLPFIRIDVQDPYQLSSVGESMLNRRHRNAVVDGTGGSALDSMVQQIWLQGVSAGEVRVVVDPLPSTDWTEAETYWIVPTLARPLLLVPSGPRRATSGSLLQYRGLRAGRINVARNVLGWLAKAGLPPAQHTLSIQLRAGTATDSPVKLPLAHLVDSLEQNRLTAAIGIRLGVNRKPTLQLFDAEGHPAGYAKCAWNKSSTGYVETEIAALQSIGGKPAAMRAPRLLTSGWLGGFPYLITEPLPEMVQAVRGDVKEPTAQEMFALCPIYRTGTISSTRHFQEIGRRLEELDSTAPDHELAAEAGRVYKIVAGSKSAVPVCRRWHGDLVPWNSAREPSGQLWCWDWESSEADAMAGLDAIHWMFSVRREQATGRVASHLLPALRDAQSHLEAASVPRPAWPDLLAVYTLVVVERAWTLTAQFGSWKDSWISRTELMELLQTAGKHLQVEDTA